MKRFQATISVTLVEEVLYYKIFGSAIPCGIPNVKMNLNYECVLFKNDSKA